MRTIRFILLTLLSTFGMTAKADLGGYYYTNYHVDAVVHKNNVWDITETMDVFFTEPRHGIYRYIPTTFSLQHDVSKDEGQKQHVIEGQIVQNWQKFNYVSKVDSIYVDNWEFVVDEDDDDFYVIRIGSAYKQVTGAQRYVLHYKYIYRDDRRPEFDYLFHTVLGTDFNEPTEHFSFKLKFEKPLPADILKRLEVYSGAYGNKDNTVQNLVIKANSNMITGRAESIQPKQGITLYAKLPADYYEDVLSVNYFWHYLFGGITLLLIVLIVTMMLTIKRPSVTKVIEFYPPDDISSAEVGTITDGSVDAEDLASLIPWLAGRGYISIKELEEKKTFTTKRDLQLTKLKDLPQDAPKYQKSMMELLFPTGQQTVKLKDIGEKPQKVESIKNLLKKKFTGKKSLTHINWSVLLYLPLMLSSTMVLATNTVTRTFDENSIILAIGLWLIPFFIGWVFRLALSIKDILGSTWKDWLALAIKTIIMACICFIYCKYLPDYGAPMSTWMIIALFASCFLLCELAGFFNVNSKYRAQMMGRLLGFKEFIKTAEQSRLEALQADDPQYFYKVLPYAMVFGLTKKWTKLFEKIDVQQPEWYESASPLVGHALTAHMTSSLLSSTNSTISAISTVSHNSSSSGGYSSGGGGFSGGGGGGGGGGSW
ncbi:MAG: DUF2207 domain-containing protein [Bacteroidaceae bacterium]|nr:DUF2207 domain-containing protein [Bacteroidaceae bacterium]